ncbi:MULTISPECIES: sporulation protein [unclassified Staphylococcus]|uniref:sporulation protein n=1 Tax=unclassified Staphylococcus TaxID=91994 RepID=UPI0021D109D4|nr:MULTISPECIES: sporulation protein [unclassified Staphylococcus]UXR68803.1 sporulation protein [Staphylococcus sp. IVB6246]UXR70860.1 sporulation protein [Staphylococcus sp. IVB6240]UXR73090.1 sporulation protein [Staphylococcus sp. IVB6238]UXR75386.1 sporulation protein [Staphylococcus sp. IVB6233]UXR79589.1 sporulation protein [Staphylococcus sp. IVB6218]
MGFDNILTSLGIEGMKVIIHLDQESYTVDDTITGYIKLKAGMSDQKVTHIELKLLEKYENDDETSEFTFLTNELDRFVMDEKFLIDEKEQKVIEFTLEPKSLNFKSETSKIFLNTHVYIDLGIDEEVEAEVPYQR